MASQDLTKLLDAIEPELRRDLLLMFARTSERVTVTQIETLIAQGRIDEAINLVIPQAEVFAAAWTTSYVLAGNSTATFVSGTIPIEVVFDQVNVRAVLAMQNNSLRLVQSLNQAQRNATREALVDGIRRGINPRDAARAVKDSIGLTATQVRAVNNYRRALMEGDSKALQLKLRDKRFDPTVARSIRTGSALSQAQVDKLVARYVQRQLIYRSEVIARTEALRSAHEGAEEMFQQAIDSGAINAEDLTGTWHTARDTRVRDTHITMEGQQRPWGEPFVSGRGNLLMRPGDQSAPASEVVQCRCALTYQIRTPVASNVTISAEIR
jgi:hypothetical protein